MNYFTIEYTIPGHVEIYGIKAFLFHYPDNTTLREVISADNVFQAIAKITEPCFKYQGVMPRINRIWRGRFPVDNFYHPEATYKGFWVEPLTHIPTEAEYHYKLAGIYTPIIRRIRRARGI